MRPSTNPIKKYEHGYPCMLDGKTGWILGRIVGESEKGSWGIFNGERMYSIPQFSTPGGTLIETGVAYLSEMSEEGLRNLVEFERLASEKGQNYYSGKYSNQPTLPQGLMDAIFKTALGDEAETIEAPVDRWHEALTQKSYMVGVHRYAFRAGEPAEIVGLKWVKPRPLLEWRLAYEIEFFDGKNDFIAVQDVLDGNHVIISDVDLANGRIPEISR